MALLTPKDIREHTFQTVRFKEGYDVDEVDDFLDQVTETVEALGKQAVASGQATQSLPPDVAKLNSKISELTAQVQSLQSENEQLKSAAPVASKDRWLRRNSPKPRRATARCPSRTSSSRIRWIAAAARSTS